MLGIQWKETSEAMPGVGSHSLLQSAHILQNPNSYWACDNVYAQPLKMQWFIYYNGGIHMYVSTTRVETPKKVKRGMFQTDPELSGKFNKPKCPMPQRLWLSSIRTPERTYRASHTVWCRKLTLKGLPESVLCTACKTFASEAILIRKTTEQQLHRAQS